MKVVVLRGVPVHLIQSHGVAEERIPADRELHPSTEGVLSLGV